jgi:hypothetical protein
MNEEPIIAVTMKTLEHHDHITGDIDRGIEIYNENNVEFMQDDPTYYRVIVPLKGNGYKSVSITFSKDGHDLDDFRCGCTYLTKNHGLLCCHVVAAVLAIQGGFPRRKKY